MAAIPDVRTDLVIVGCGPVGAVTANLLGRHGVDVIVLDRDTAPHGQPRAFSCDDEALRVYQAAGLVAVLRADMYPAPLVRFVDDRGGTFAEIAMSEVDFGLGYGVLNFFDQPVLERALRQGLDRYPHVALRLGHESVALSQDAERVTVTVREVATGREYRVLAKYVLGCDGAGSSTRALAGITLRGSSYEEPWLAVSGDVEPAAVREDCTLFVCDWRRPAFVSPAPNNSYRLEFMLRPGETRADVERPEKIEELISPYVDPAGFTVRRAAVYGFHTLTAECWRAGRVFLVGDAAHQMPPFLGQGLCSGLRDAANLSWKLAFVLAGRAAAGLLDSYEVERRPHAEEMATTSVRIGRLFLARNRRVARVRDAALRAVQRIPRVRRFVRHFEFKPTPVHRRGWTAAGAVGRVRKPAGTMFPQPRVTAARPGPGPVGEPRLLDEVLGGRFAVIGPGVRPEWRDQPPWRDLPVRLVRVHPPAAASSAGAVPGAVSGGGAPDYEEVVDVDGVLGEWFGRHRTKVAVLRPDRFVFGVAGAAGAAAVGEVLARRLGATSATADGAR